VVGTLALLASLLNVLLFHRYPLLTSEVALLVAAILAIAAIMVPVYTGQRRWGKAMLAGLLVFLLVDLNADSLWAAVVLGLAAAAASWKMGAGLLRFLALLAGVALMTSLLGLTERRSDSTTAGAERVEPGPAKGRPPLLVHLILDEFEGIRGMQSMTGAPGLGAAVERQLVEAGFAVVPDAYSRRYHSIESIPTILNFGAAHQGSGDGDVGGATGPLRYLQLLDGLGYWIHVRQTSFLDLCSGNPVDDCRTFWRDNLAGIRGTGLSAADRAWLILTSMAKSMTVAKVAAVAIDALLAGRSLGGEPIPAFRLINRGDVGGINSEREFRRLIVEVERAGPGDAFVAHLLLPHFPYVFTGDCRLKPYRDWRISWQRHPIEQRQQAYSEQVECTVRRIRELAQAASRSSAGGNQIIIIHGDHGSRIRDERLAPSKLETASDEDLLHGFSTLFAMKLPNTSAQVIEGQQPVSAILGTLAPSGFSETEMPSQPRYVLRDDQRHNSTARRIPISDWTRR
jgi:hypothetical protein